MHLGMQTHTQDFCVHNNSFYCPVEKDTVPAAKLLLFSPTVMG